MQIRSEVTSFKESIRTISELAGSKPGCIRFDIGQPDFDTPSHIKAAAMRAIRAGKTGYTPTTGLPKLRDAIAASESKKGRAFSPENVLVTVGGMSALFSVMFSILNRGDEVVITDPSWSLYPSQVKICGGVPVYADIESPESAITDKTKALIVNSPSNPTGQMLSEADIKKVTALCDERDIFLISDEVYGDLAFDKPHISPAKFTDRAIIVNSCSKTYAMTGWRLGWLVAKPQLVEEFSKCTRSMFACPNHISQYAAVAALTGDQSSVDDMRDEYRLRKDTLIKRMNSLGWNFPSVDGGIYAFPDVGQDGWSFVNKLLENNISAVPGEPFGPSAKNHIRLCFGSVGVEKINAAFDVIDGL